MSARTRQPNLLQAPGAWSCTGDPLPAVLTSPPSRTFSGSCWAVLSQWRTLQTRASPRAEEAELSRFAQTCPCCNQCRQLLHSKNASPLSGQVWTPAHGDLAISDSNSRSSMGRMSSPSSHSWRLMIAFPCITISHLALQPEGNLRVYTG